MALESLCLEPQMDDSTSVVENAGDIYDFAWQALCKAEEYESPAKERIFVELCLAQASKR